MNYQEVRADSSMGANLARPAWNLRRQPSSSFSGTTSDSLGIEERQHWERQCDSLMRQVWPLVQQTRTANWDAEQGEPIAPAQWVSAMLLAFRALFASLPVPFVSACGDGTVHLQWTTRFGNRGVVEIDREAIGWSFLPMTSSDGEDLVVELRSMDDALERVRALHSLR
jgi:hypothetical protein